MGVVQGRVCVGNGVSLTHGGAHCLITWPLWCLCSHLDSLVAFQRGHQVCWDYAVSLLSVPGLGSTNLFLFLFVQCGVQWPTGAFLSFFCYLLIRFVFSPIFLAGFFLVSQSHKPACSPFKCLCIIYALCILVKKMFYVALESLWMTLYVECLYVHCECCIAWSLSVGILHVSCYWHWHCHHCQFFGDVRPVSFSCFDGCIVGFYFLFFCAILCKTLIYLYFEKKNSYEKNTEWGYF